MGKVVLAFRLAIFDFVLDLYFVCSKSRNRQPIYATKNVAIVSASVLLEKEIPVVN